MSQLSEGIKQLRNHKWEVEVGKQLLKQPTNLMPVHQFWELILQWANMQAEPADSLLNRKDYTNFLKRMDKFSVWIDSAMVYMKEVENEMLTKGIDRKN
jgi:hypothetical protein